jgi:hypothetical protein
MQAAQDRTGWTDLQARTFENGETVYYSPSAYNGDGGTVSFDADGVPRVHGFSGDPVTSGAQAGTTYVTPSTVTGPPTGSVPVQMPDGSVSYYDGNGYYDLDGNQLSVADIEPGVPTDVAGPYTPAQETRYNELIQQGKTPTEATDIVDSESGPVAPPFQVDVSGVAGTAEAPSYAIPEQMTPGSQLATQVEIDAGQATWNPAANAWEVAAPVAPTPVVAPPFVIDPVQALPGVTPPVEAIAEVPITAPPLSPVEPVEIVSPPPIPEVVVPEQPAPPPVVVEPPPVVVEPPPVAPPPDMTPDNIDAGGGWNPGTTPVSDAVPVAVPERPVIAPPPIQPGPVPVEDAVARPPGTPQPGLGGYTMPPVSAADLALLAAGWYYLNGVLTPPDAPATRAPYGPIAPTTFGQTGALVNPGLNPGFIQPTPFYNTTSPVQAKFNYGQRALQTGATFDPLAYNNVPGASAQPYGLQQLYTPTDIAQYLATQPVAPRI